MKISKIDNPEVKTKVVKLLTPVFDSFIPLNPITPKKKDIMVRAKIMDSGWTFKEFSTEFSISVKLNKKNNPKQTKDAMKE